MELTNEQIQKVEIYLQKKRFDYIDLKYEVLDHMISDIEKHLDNNISFENAFKMTVLKWNKHFEETNSLYFGIIYNEPKLVIKKAIKQFKGYFLLYFTLYILPVLFLRSSEIKVDASFSNFINGFVLSTSLAGCGYVIYIAFKVISLKVKTTYSFILKTQYTGAFLLLIGAFVGVFDNNHYLNNVFLGFVLAGYAVVFICNHFYAKHRAIIEKYKLS